MSFNLATHGLFATHGLYSRWYSPSQNTGMGSLSLLQGIFLIHELNQGLLHCRHILYQLSYQGSPLCNPRTKNVSYIYIRWLKDYGKEIAFGLKSLKYLLKRKVSYP